MQCLMNTNTTLLILCCQPEAFHREVSNGRILLINMLLLPMKWDLGQTILVSMQKRKLLKEVLKFKLLIGSDEQIQFYIFYYIRLN